MSAKDRPESAPPADYRTLIPGANPKPPPKPAPMPAAAPAAGKPDAAKPEADKPHDDPTRFGDWEVKGRCIDF